MPPTQFRYNTSGQWFKGNTHIHSTMSDGGLTFPELSSLYTGAGYHFLFRTDHWFISNVKNDPTPYPILWLDGIELDGIDNAGTYYHVVCLGTLQSITREMGFVSALESARRQNALLILAHPLWTGNSLDEAIRHGFHGVEVYNHVCRWINGKSDGSTHWNALLRRRPDILGLSSDDSHTRKEHPGWNGGWIVVNAPSLTRDTIFNAIRLGNFYSSCGPEFHSITGNTNLVTVTTSPVRFIRLVGPDSSGCPTGSFDGPVITEATFEIPKNWNYHYIEIEDEVGRRAWTNALFT